VERKYRILKRGYMSFFFLVILVLSSLQGRAGLTPSHFCLDFKPPTHHISTSSNTRSPQNRAKPFHSDHGSVPLQMHRSLNMNVAMRKNISTLKRKGMVHTKGSTLPPYLCYSPQFFLCCAINSSRMPGCDNFSVRRAQPLSECHSLSTGCPSAFS